MSKDKEEAKEKYKDANKLYDAEIYNEALTSHQKVATLDLTFIDAHFCVAKTHIRLQSFEKGLTYFQKHINLIPKKARSIYSVGLAGTLLDEGQNEKAFDLVKEHGDDVTGEQLHTFLKILLANGKVNLVLLHLLNIPFQKSTKIYEQIVNESPL